MAKRVVINTDAITAPEASVIAQTQRVSLPDVPRGSATSAEAWRMVAQSVGAVTNAAGDIGEAVRYRSESIVDQLAERETEILSYKDAQDKYPALKGWNPWRKARWDERMGEAAGNRFVSHVDAWAKSNAESLPHLSSEEGQKALADQLVALSNEWQGEDVSDDFKKGFGPSMQAAQARAYNVIFAEQAAMDESRALESAVNLTYSGIDAVIEGGKDVEAGVIAMAQRLEESFRLDHRFLGTDEVKERAAMLEGVTAVLLDRDNVMVAGEVLDAISKNRLFGINQAEVSNLREAVARMQEQVENDEWRKSERAKSQQIEALGKNLSHGLASGRDPEEVIREAIANGGAEGLSIASRALSAIRNLREGTPDPEVSANLMVEAYSRRLRGEEGIARVADHLRAGSISMEHATSLWRLIGENSRHDNVFNRPTIHALMRGIEQLGRDEQAVEKAQEVMQNVHAGLLDILDREPELRDSPLELNSRATQLVNDEVGRVFKNTTPADEDKINQISRISEELGTAIAGLENMTHDGVSAVLETIPGTEDARTILKQRQEAQRFELERFRVRKRRVDAHLYRLKRLRALGLGADEVTPLNVELLPEDELIFLTDDVATEEARVAER